ncbi:MAG TPA: hypothetical protein VIH61_03730 [Waddliaceae bacterium]
MSDTIINTSSESVSSAPVQPSSSDPSVAGAAAATNAPKSMKETTFTTVGSLAELKEKAPDVYNMMMQGIAQNIISEMRERQERLKKLMREGTPEQQG